MYRMLNNLLCAHACNTGVPHVHTRTRTQSKHEKRAHKADIAHKVRTKLTLRAKGARTQGTHKARTRYARSTRSREQNSELYVPGGRSAPGWTVFGVQARFILAVGYFYTAVTTVMPI